MPDILNPDGTISQDLWLTLDDEQAIPDGAQIIVSLNRWQAQRDALLNEAKAVGVSLDNTQCVDALASDSFADVALIALNFPAFTDGRAYSQARLLRERLHFKGTLRACGEVLHDQLFYMLRCGFDSFEIPAGLNTQQAEKFLHTFSVAYQPTSSGPKLQRPGPLA